MNKRNWLCVGILSVVLVFAMIFVACGGGSPDEEEQSGSGPQPVTYVGYDPEGNSYTLEVPENVQAGNEFTFTVEQRELDTSYTNLLESTGTVTSVDIDEEEGTITIVIEVNGEELTILIEDGAIKSITGDIVDGDGQEIIATPSRLDPPGEEGEWVDPYPVQKPLIASQSGTKRYMTNTSINQLSVSVTPVSDGGDLTLQWYSSDIFTTTGGVELTGQTGATYQPVSSGEGTTYYYLIATNTKIYDEGEPTEVVRVATTASAPIGVIVIDSLPVVTTTITITDTQNQYVRGFGGMSNAFGIGAPAKYMQMADIDTMFNPSNPNYLGFKILRIIIFPNPLTDVLRGYVEPQMGNGQTYLQAVKEVNRHGGYVLASPWTPPANYKTNNSLLAGGSLKTEMYAGYASYLRGFAQSMRNNDAPIYAISIQNEPSLEVSYHGMEWSAAQQRDFLNARGANISRMPTAIKGWGGGKETEYVKVMTGEAHQIGAWYTGAMNALLANTAVAQNALAQVDIVGYHIYGGNGDKNSVTMGGRLPAAGKETWMSERNLNSQSETLYWRDSTWDYVWEGMGDMIHHVIGVNDSSAFVYWYLKRFYSAIGDGSWNTVNGAVLPRGHVLSHYALYATDTVRVNATTNHSAGTATMERKGIQLTAYQRKSNANKTTDRDNDVMANENSYSVVIADNRVGGGGGATEMRVSVPAGFTASKVTGIISDTNRRRAPLDIMLNPDGKSADFTLPENAIVSLKFEE